MLFETLAKDIIWSFDWTGELRLLFEEERTLHRQLKSCCPCLLAIQKIIKASPKIKAELDALGGANTKLFVLGKIDAKERSTFGLSPLHRAPLYKGRQKGRLAAALQMPSWNKALGHLSLD
jgi:hypothetical protein